MQRVTALGIGALGLAAMVAEAPRRSPEPVPAIRYEAGEPARPAAQQKQSQADSARAKQAQQESPAPEFPGFKPRERVREPDAYENDARGFGTTDFL